MRISRLFQIVWIALLVLLAPTVLPAQFRGGGGGPPSPERMFQFMDRNQNGMLDRDEIERMPPLRDFLVSKGVDISQPLRLEDFTQYQTEFGESMMRGRRGPRGPEDGSRREESPRRDDRQPPPEVVPGPDFRASAPQQFAPPAGPPAASPPATAPGSAAPAKPAAPAKGAPVPRPRATIPMPDQFRSRDANRDGQIGLYEWPRSDYASFRRMDRDGDGFLTPLELVKATGGSVAAAMAGTPAAPPGSPPAAAATPAPTTTAPPTATAPGTPAAPTTPQTVKVTSTSVPAPDTTPSAAISPDTARALTAFDSLDRDKDGIISSEEWDRSRTMRPLFEKAGIDLKQPLPKDRFLALFPSVIAGG